MNIKFQTDLSIDFVITVI